MLGTEAYKVGDKMSDFELTFGHQLTLFLAGFIVVFIILKVYFKW